MSYFKFIKFAGNYFFVENAVGTSDSTYQRQWTVSVKRIAIRPYLVTDSTFLFAVETY